MESQPDLASAAASALRACEAMAAQLSAAGAPSESLAEYVAPRRVLLMPRPARMLPVGDVWRLGTLLLGTDGRLHSLGAATRARERGRASYQSESREVRRDIAAAALRGGYTVGTAVNYDTHELELTPASIAALGADDPIGFAAGEVRVRWRPGAPLDGGPTLEAYLRDRVELLLRPLA